MAQRTSGRAEVLRGLKKGLMKSLTSAVGGKEIKPRNFEKNEALVDLQVGSQSHKLLVYVRRTIVGCLVAVHHKTMHAQMQPPPFHAIFPMSYHIEHETEAQMLI